MQTNIKEFEDFKNQMQEKLYVLLKDSKIMNEKLADATVHALVDISKSIEKIYTNIIVNMVECALNDKEKIEDLLQDLKFEFSHILYHMEDADLIGLKYWE